MLTITVSTMRIELAACIPIGDVQRREVSDARDLHVIGCLHEMRASDRAVGNEARPVARLDAPRDLDALRLPDRGVCAGLGGREDAEVVYRVDCGMEELFRFRKAEERKEKA